LGLLPAGCDFTAAALCAAGTPLGYASGPATRLQARGVRDSPSNARRKPPLTQLSYGRDDWVCCLLGAILQQQRYAR